MAVFPRGGVYWYEFWFAGQRVRESAKTTSKTLAKEAEKNRRRELEEAFNNITDRRHERIRTFRDMAEEFFNSYKIRLTRRSWILPATFRSRCSSTTATFAWKRNATHWRRSSGSSAVLTIRTGRPAVQRGPPKNPHRVRRIGNRVRRAVRTRNRKRIGLRPKLLARATQECL